MTSFKNKIKAYFRKKKLNVFATFVILALLFSVLTKLSNNYTKTIVFNINTVNVPEDEVIVIDSSQVIDITLATYGFKLIKYYFKTPTIDIDFSNLQKNKTEYLWVEKQKKSNIISQFDAKIKIENIAPDTIAFQYGINAIKTVPIILNSQINYSTGFDLSENLKIKPDSVKIIGPLAIIDTISKIETENIIFKDVKKDISKTVQLKLPASNNDLSFSISEINLKGKVEKFTEGSVEVPVIVKNIPDSIQIKYYPKTIPVLYYTSLNNYKSITSNSFVVECDFKELNTKSTYLTPKIMRQPDKVKNVKLNVKRIEFILIQ